MGTGSNQADRHESNIVSSWSRGVAARSRLGYRTIAPCSISSVSLGMCTIATCLTEAGDSGGAFTRLEPGQALGDTPSSPGLTDDRLTAVESTLSCLSLSNGVSKTREAHDGGGVDVPAMPQLLGLVRSTKKLTTTYGEL